MLGPVTYDLVSLLRDCYISWPRELVEGWVKGYHQLALESGIPVCGDDDEFLRWFDLMVLPPKHIHTFTLRTLSGHSRRVALPPAQDAVADEKSSEGDGHDDQQQDVAIWQRVDIVMLNVLVGGIIEFLEAELATL